MGSAGQIKRGWHVDILIELDSANQGQQLKKVKVNVLTMYKINAGALLGFTEDGCDIREREQFGNSLS